MISNTTLGYLDLVLLVILLLLRIPIGFAMALAGTAGILAIQGLGGAIYGLGSYPFSFARNWIMCAFPLFILMGNLAASAGVSDRAFSVAHKWMGRWPGGLALATILACAAFGATSGSSVAVAGTMGRIAVPEMARRNYNLRFACGCVAAGGSLGIMIPPSTMFVLYGALTMEPVGKLLIAGIIPGLVTAFFYMVTIFLLVKGNPSLAPRNPERFSWWEKAKVIPELWGVMLLFSIVVGGIYGGVFTPTEAAAAGAFSALCLAARFGKKGLRPIRQGFESTAETTAMIMAIMIGASLFSYSLVITGMPEKIVQFVTHLDMNRYSILFIIIAFYIPLGMFLDNVSIMFISLPIFYPVIHSLGFNGIWFGVLVVKMQELAVITPPVGFNVFVLKSVVPNISLDEIFKGIFPFIITDLVLVAILIAFPWLSTWLPEMMLGKS
jgi:C4-dicarboxylate transporter, DctM subunit